MPTANTTNFQVVGNNPKALFTLKLHRGDGMLLLAMNWKKGKPAKDFVGFAIEYKEPGGDKFYSLKNRISFANKDGTVNNVTLSTMQSPIQKFRWVHFPRNAEIEGAFEYNVIPVFMNDQDELSYGESQSAKIALSRETYKDKLNVTFTRGFVLSQAFVDYYESKGSFKTLMPPNAEEGLTFKPTHPEAKEALDWMGFEARHAILEVLDLAIKDKTAKVKAVVYDLSEPEIVNRFVKLGKRLSIIIDDSTSHKPKETGESQSERKLVRSAGRANVIRQHLGSLQHNKTIVVTGDKVKKAVCGSTNFSWRGFYVQNNNAIILNGAKAIKPFLDAFDNYWNSENNVSEFGGTDSALWHSLGFNDIDAKVSFSPHIKGNFLLDEIANDIKRAKSSVLFSLAFLHQTPGPVSGAVKNAISSKKIFAYGVSDKKTGGIDISTPDGNTTPVYPSELDDAPEPFKNEPKGGGGNRMHHKFIVIDFDKPDARVYMGSYNFSDPADTKNGENLLLIKDKRIAVSYMIEAVRIFDHYHFRVARKEAKKSKKALVLSKPPGKAGEVTWWDKYYKNKQKINDREIFA
jgi:hypothetical protein